MLAVDQDSLGRQASRIFKKGDIEVWAKNLEDGSKAVGLFNLGKTQTDVAVDFNSLELKGNCLVRDLWRQKDLGDYEKQFKTTANSHGVVFVKIKKINKGSKKTNIPPLISRVELQIIRVICEISG